MERCTDNRSTTPPLKTIPITSKAKENGKQKFESSLYDIEDQADISQSISIMSSTANDTLYVSSTPPPIPLRTSKSSALCNYDSTSDEEDKVTENNSKSTSDRFESTKSSVINAKYRKSEERDRKHRRDRRRSRESSSRRKSKDRKHRRSTSRHRSKESEIKRRRSRSEKRSITPKDVPMELPKDIEFRRTVTEPSLVYCENGRQPCSWSKRTNLEQKPKVRRIEDANEYPLDDGIAEQSGKTPTVQPCSSSPKVGEVTSECSPSKPSSDDCFKSSTDKELIDGKVKRKQFEPEDMFSCEIAPMPSNCVLPVNTEQPSSNQQSASECEVRTETKQNSLSHESSDNMDVTSTTPETPKTPSPPIECKKVAESKLSEEKMQLYIDEYDIFIQQVASPLNEPLKKIDECITDDLMANSFVQLNESVTSDKDFPKNEVSSTSSAQKIVNEHIDEQPSTSSSSSDDDSSSTSDSSSSSSSDDSSSSSDSSTSSSSDNDDSSNDSPRRRRKSSSKSSSSRSASKSPRIRPSKANNLDLLKSADMDTDGLDFTVSNKNSQYTNGIKALINPMTFVKGMDISALKSLDALINDDDELDLFRNIESYKNHMREKRMAKQAAEKSKHHDASSNDNSFNDSINYIENGALLHDSERKKISLKLKPTTTLKQQTKEMSDSFLEIEQQTEPSQEQPQSQLQIHKENDKQITTATTNEHNDQIEKRSSDKSMSSSKKKSSHRKDDDRKSRRNEDRSRSRRSDERGDRHRSHRRKEEKRSKHSEERRPLRSEERRPRRSEEHRSRRSEEKRPRRSKESRQKRRHDRSPSPNHYRESYYSPSYRNRSMSPLPRGPRTPPNTPPPNQTEFDEFRTDDMAMRHHIPPYSTPIPPSVHYQFSTPDLQSNVPNYISYVAYMHPQQYNRPPPAININTGAPPPTMMPAMGPNSEYYYHNASPHAPAQAPHHLQNQAIPPNAYSNLIEVSPYGVPNSSNVDCIRKQSENRRKPAIAVQKGNVLEIVPSAELQCDKNADSADIEKSDKMHAINKQHQQALHRQKQDRFKRKMERHQKRLERTKRTEYLQNELTRLSHCMTFADDGKVVKASEILKSITFDGSAIKLANSKGDDENEDLEDIYIEPPIHSYDPQALVGRSILSERNDVDRTSTFPEKRRGVLFADGVVPGEGTSASEESANEDDNNITKPKKLSSRAKGKKNTKNVIIPPFTNDSTPMFLEKENSFEIKSNTETDQQVVPPQPPGSPPPNLPQPKLKEPQKFIVNQLLYFHYDSKLNEMIITPAPHMMPMMKTMTIPPPVIQVPPPVQQMIPVQPYPYKSNSSRHHSDSKVSTKLSSRTTSSSKHYHSSSSSHKPMHVTNETNLIVLSSSPSNA